MRLNRSVIYYVDLWMDLEGNKTDRRLTFRGFIYRSKREREWISGEKYATSLDAIRRAVRYLWRNKLRTVGLEFSPEVVRRYGTAKMETLELG
jgi:hypothetical protein